MMSYKQASKEGLNHTDTKGRRGLGGHQATKGAPQASFSNTLNRRHSMHG